MAKFNYLEGDMFFPFLFDKLDMFDRYSVALGLEGDQIQMAKKLGLKVKQDPEKMNGMVYVQLKSNFKPELFDTDGGPYKGPTMLTNGSKAVVKLTQRPYDNKFGQGITTFMSAVKITDPIEFVPDGAGAFDDSPVQKSKKQKAPATLDDDLPF